MQSPVFPGSSSPPPPSHLWNGGLPLHFPELPYPNLKKSLSALPESPTLFAERMKPWLKVILYTVLTALAIWASVGFYKNYKLSNEAAAKRNVESDSDTPRLTNDAGAQGRMMGNAFGLVACAIGLGFLISRDFSSWFAAKSVDFIYNDNAEGMHDPDYDHAEDVALQGNHLEAIQLLRDFLKRNPSELYAAIRIGELYEKELQNFLAAALEYEEVLKHKFNADRWGWLAIRLVNLYSGKLNKTEEAMTWLRRIATEYPDSAPAKKARERLGEPEPTASAPTESSAPAPSTPGGLPPGFSPKKQ